MAEANASSEQLESFGRALAATLKAKGLTTGALLHVASDKGGESGRNSVNRWILGKNEPSRPKVQAIEAVLELEAGTLSRHLGWVPVGAKDVPTVEAAILADSQLTASQKNILLAALHDFRSA
jgi:transcriptional regulator with XRE-family HTH domain